MTHINQSVSHPLDDLIPYFKIFLAKKLTVVDVFNQRFSLVQTFLTVRRFKSIKTEEHMGLPLLLMFLNLLNLGSLFEPFQVLIFSPSLSSEQNIFSIRIVLYYAYYRFVNVSA